MTPDPWDMWFWCPSCDIEFQDPYAEEQDGVVYAQCICERMYDRPLPDASEQGDVPHPDQERLDEVGA